MADVRALRGVRYHPPLAAAIGHLVAPPYDASPAAEGPSSGAPYNVGRLENVVLGDDGDPHALAATRYRAWRRQGVLARDPAPALYLHHQAFDDGDRRLIRRGLLARVRLADWEERVVLPHERTFPGPRRERLERLRAVGANLSPLYLLYHDPAGELRAILAAAEAEVPAAEAGTDPTGAEHRLTVLADPALHDRVSRFFADRRLYVADGHHRYEAALAYRDERRSASPTAGYDVEAPSEFVLVLLADVADPGVRVLPTHRLVHGWPGFDPGRFRTELARFFALERVPDSVASPGVARSGADGGVPLCELRFADDPSPWRLRTKPGAPHAALMPTGPGQAWRTLDVAILGSVVLERLLGLGADRLPTHVAFTHEAAAARAAVAGGRAQLALILAPPSLADLTAVAEAGDLLPPKSTYFDPKAPAGLVINELTE